MLHLEDKYKSIGVGEDEGSLHQKLIKECKLGAVEIGVLYGDTTRLLCSSNLNIPIYGIDPLIPDSMNSNLVGSKEKILKNTVVCGNFTFFNDYSYNVVKDFDYEFDYLFIDGDHQYDAVKRDFEEWYPKLSHGGYVLIHDSAANRGGPYWWDGPSKLADELIDKQELEYVTTVYCLTAFRKQ